MSRVGSHIAVREFCRSALAFARGGNRPIDLNKEVASQWLDGIRDRIGQVALREKTTLRSFAATLLGCLVYADAVSIVHIGDGACALRLRNETVWQVPSWPAQGEYGSVD